MRRLYSLFFILVSSYSIAETYHFVSINDLIEQEIGRIIMPEIYDKLDMSITITPLPGKRAQFEATSGASDGEIMRIFTYGLENETVVRVPTPYYYLETMAFIRKDSNVVINTKEDLKNYKIVKVRGVKHTNNITHGHDTIVDLNTTEQIMKFLDKGRADVALTNTVDGLMVINDLGLKNIVKASEPLATLDLYHYIHEDHKHLVPKVDAVIKQMIASGELDNLVQDAETAVIDKRVTSPD